MKEKIENDNMFQSSRENLLARKKRETRTNWCENTAKIMKRSRTYRIIEPSNDSILPSHGIEASSKICLFFVSAPFHH